MNDLMIELTDNGTGRTHHLGLEQYQGNLFVLDAEGFPIGSLWLNNGRLTWGEFGPDAYDWEPRTSILVPDNTITNIDGVETTQWQLQP